MILMGKDPQAIISQCKSYAREIVQYLGNNMTEEVYHEAFALLLEDENVYFRTEMPITNLFYNIHVGTMHCDLFVENRVVVELKAKRNLHPCDKIQLRKYMRALGVQHGLLINFREGSNKLHFVTTILSNESSKFCLCVIFETLIFLSTFLYFYARHFRNIDFPLYFSLFLCASLLKH